MLLTAKTLNQLRSLRKDHLQLVKTISNIKNWLEKLNDDLVEWNVILPTPQENKLVSSSHFSSNFSSSSSSNRNSFSFSSNSTFSSFSSPVTFNRSSSSLTAIGFKKENKYEDAQRILWIL